MASKLFGVSIDLDLNQLVNARAQNGTGFTTGGATSKGRVVYDTSDNKLKYDNGSQIVVLADNSDVLGLLDFKGGYDANANTPDLESGSGVLKGDYYVVTTGGSFFTEVLAVGDSLFAKNDAPTTLAEWVIVQGNVVSASETASGTVELATQAEVDTATDSTRAITPATLKGASYIANMYSTSVVVGAGATTSVTHGLANSNPVVSIKKASTGEEITLLVTNFTSNAFDIVKDGATYSVNVAVQG